MVQWDTTPCLFVVLFKETSPALQSRICLKVFFRHRFDFLQHLWDRLQDRTSTGSVTGVWLRTGMRGDGTLNPVCLLFVQLSRLSLIALTNTPHFTPDCFWDGDVWHRNLHLPATSLLAQLDEIQYRNHAINSAIVGARDRHEVTVNLTLDFRSPNLKKFILTRRNRRPT